ncbi:MAG: rhodanese-like domain-containing protein [Mogibacterium sp.]|nr:rhodanese-like domain-containing protein [Mogibacterium sp.]
MKHKNLVLVMALIMTTAFILGSCGTGYKQISQDEAMKIMEEESGFLIVDVRRPDEFAEGHIEGAINVPNEGIAEEMPEELPDKDQLLLIYCRTGRRSKEASEKLAKIGYKNVYEFGGINTWTGTIVTGD